MEQFVLTQISMLQEKFASLFLEPGVDQPIKCGTRISHLFIKYVYQSKH